MPRIRTDRHALLLAFAMGSAFFFFCTRNYVLELPEAMRTWDRLALWCGAGGATYLALFTGGHLVLRRLGVGARGAYAALGAAACVAAFCIFGLFGQLAAAFERGAGLGYLIMPALIGAVFGFLYAYRAGWDAAGDDPAALSEALAGRIAGTPGGGADLTLLSAGGADYYDGPMQVRTSLPLMLLSAVFAAILAGLLRGAMLIGHEVSLLGDVGMSRMVDHALLSTGAAGVELTFLMIVAVLPMTLIILAGHYIARGLRTTSPVAYFGIGLVLPPVLAVLSMFLLVWIGLMIMLPTAIAMVIYRRMAGLEPVPVKEDVIVRDPRDLVSANHPRRRFGRVIRSR